MGQAAIRLWPMPDKASIHGREPALWSKARPAAFITSYDNPFTLPVFTSMSMPR
jgi:hypothetical protein